MGRESEREKLCEGEGGGEVEARERRAELSQGHAVEGRSHGGEGERERGAEVVRWRMAEWRGEGKLRR
jgi:hypothetical protein